MTRLKKLLVTGLLVLVSCCTYLGSAIVNVAHSIFSFGSASASTFNGGNTNNSGSAIKQGNILSVSKMPSTAEKGRPVSLPFGADIKVYSATTTTGSQVDSSVIFAEVINPYGEALTSFDNVENKTVATANGEAQLSIGSDTLTLTPNVSGTYKVRYHSKSSNEVWTSTDFYSVRVSTDTYEIKYAVNDSLVMPSTIRIDETNADKSWAKREVSVALPLLYDEKGDIIEKDIVLGDSFEENSTQYNYVIKYDTLKDQKLNQVTGLNLTENTYKFYKTYTIKKVATSSLTDVKYKLDISLGSGTLTLGGSIGENAVVYNNVAYKFNAQAGKNVINYRLYDYGTSNILAYYTYTVTGSKSYDSENIKLTATPISTIKSSSTKYKEKNYLPKVNAINSNSSNASVNAYYYYIIKAVDSEGNYDASSSKVVMGKDENGFYFIPEGNSNTRYEIYYNVVDFYGNKAEDDDNYDYEITVRDRKLDEYYYTSSYDVEHPENAKKDDLTYMIPTKVLTKEGKVGTVTLPAIWADDVSGIAYVSRSVTSSEKTFINEKGEKTSATINVTNDDGSTNQLSLGKDVNDLLVFEDYQGNKYYEVLASGNVEYSIKLMEGESRADSDLVVYYKDGNGNYRKAEGGVKADTDPEVSKTDMRNFKNSCVAKLTLDPTIFGAGTYNFSVTIRDNANNTNINNRTFSFEVVTEEFDTSTPTLKFGDSTIANVVDEQDIKFAIPEASDSIDKKLLVRYFVAVGDKYQEVFTGEDGKYIEFNTGLKMDETNSLYDLASLSESKSFEIVAYAYNDYANYDADIKAYNESSDDYKGIARASYKISIKYQNDTVAPYFNVIDQTSPSLIQYEEVSVGGVTFYDDTDSAKIKVTITDTKGNQYSYKDLSGSTIVTREEGLGGSYKYKYQFAGIKFVPTNADANNYYTVTYTLVDGGDNVVSYSFVLVKAEDRTKPVVSGISGTKKTLELGQQLTLNGLKVEDNATIQSNMKIKVSCKNSEGTYFSQFARVSESKDKIEFAPDRPGVYTLTITATDEANNTSDKRIVEVEVKDTTKPEIYLQGANSSDVIVDESDITEDTDKKLDFPTVTIPSFTVEDKEPTDMAVTLSDDIFGATGVVTITAPKKDKNNVSEFVFNLDGTSVNPAVENTLEFTKVGDTFTFKPTARGEYKVVYSGEDRNGNSAESKTILVSVGDTEKPEIILTNSFKTKLDKGFVLGENDTLVVNLNARIYNETGYDSEDIYVRDNIGFDYSTDEKTGVNYVKVTLSITNPSGTTLTKEDTEDNLNHYKFDKQGTYTLTISVTDENGNKETYTRSFVVKAKSTSSVDTTTIIGTVLIVISSLILVGIIIYLVRGVKLLPKKNRKSGNKEKTNLDKKED